MKVIHQAGQLVASGRPVCVAIGMFDGVHLGHQRVLAHTVADSARTGGLPLAITFDQHPNSVVAPDRTPRLIYRLEQRLRVIASLGLEVILLIHFDRAFSRQSGEDFVTALVGDFGRVQSINIGRNFTFGYRRTGNVALLRALGLKLGFAVHDLPPVSFQGKVVSSTRCREVISAGHLELASEMLGRRYAIAGQVVPGERLGRTLGFPTANLNVAGMVLPPRGVYAGYARIANQVHEAVMNIGLRPTFDRPNPEVRVEVHVLDFAGELYGQELEFEFVRRLRAEEQFDSLEALRAQIGRDVAAARNSLGP